MRLGTARTGWWSLLGTLFRWKRWKPIEFDDVPMFVVVFIVYVYMMEIFHSKRLNWRNNNLVGGLEHEFYFCIDWE